jgi:hypothetical protein
VSLSFSNLTSGQGTAATSFTTASVAPAGNQLLLLAVSCRVATGSIQPPTPTITGNGLTWELVDATNGHADYDATGVDRSTLFLFRSMGASPSSGTIVIDFVTMTLTQCDWSLDQSSAEVDTSGANGSGAVVQTAKNEAGNNVNTLTVTLAAFGDAVNNAAFGAFSHQHNSEATSPGAGFTELADVAPTGNLCTLETEWVLGQDTSVDASWATATNRSGGIAVEVKAAAGGVAAAPDGSPGLSPAWFIRRGLWRPIVGNSEASAAAPDQPLVATGISGAEAVGAATVTPGDVTITATGVSGAEAVGSVALTQTITATGITTAEGVGAAAVGQGLVAAGITTAEQSGQATVTPGTVTITATGISSGDRVGIAALSLNLTVAGISSGEISGQSAVGQGLVATGISSGERLGAAVVTPGTVTVTATGIGSAEAVGAVQVSLGASQALSATGISGAERLGAVTVTATATIAPAGVGSLEQSGSATIMPGPVALAAVGISSLAAMGNAVAGAGLLAAGITSAERSGQPVFTVLAPTAVPKAALIEPGTRAFAGIEPAIRAGAGAEPGTRTAAAVVIGTKAGAQIELGTRTAGNIEEGV